MRGKFRSILTHSTAGNKAKNKMTIKSKIIVKYMFIFIFITCGKFRLYYLGKATAATTEVLLIATSVCSIFECTSNGISMAASVWNCECTHRRWCF